MRHQETKAVKRLRHGNELQQKLRPISMRKQLGMTAFQSKIWILPTASK
jgi:hypothetical protein